MPLTLGTEPDGLDVILIPGADFVETVETLTPDQSGPQPWPIGTVIRLVLGDSDEAQGIWDATVNVNIVSWAVEQTEVDRVIAARLRSARLWYINGTVSYPLAIGEISVYG